MSVCIFYHSRFPNNLFIVAFLTVALVNGLRPENSTLCLSHTHMSIVNVFCGRDTLGGQVIRVDGSKCK